MEEVKPSTKVARSPGVTDGECNVSDVREGQSPEDHLKLLPD